MSSDPNKNLFSKPNSNSINIFANPVNTSQNPKPPFQTDPNKNNQRIQQQPFVTNTNQRFVNPNQNSNNIFAQNMPIISKINNGGQRISNAEQINKQRVEDVNKNFSLPPKQQKKNVQNIFLKKNDIQSKPNPFAKNTTFQIQNQLGQNINPKSDQKKNLNQSISANKPNSPSKIIPGSRSIFTNNQKVQEKNTGITIINPTSQKPSNTNINNIFPPKSQEKNIVSPKFNDSIPSTNENFFKKSLENRINNNPSNNNPPNNQNLNEPEIKKTSPKKQILPFSANKLKPTETLNAENLFKQNVLKSTEKSVNESGNNSQQISNMAPKQIFNNPNNNPNNQNIFLKQNKPNSNANIFPNSSNISFGNNPVNNSNINSNVNKTNTTQENRRSQIQNLQRLIKPIYHPFNDNINYEQLLIKNQNMDSLDYFFLNDQIYEEFENNTQKFIKIFEKQPILKRKIYQNIAFFNHSQERQLIYNNKFSNFYEFQFPKDININNNNYNQRIKQFYTGFFKCVISFTASLLETDQLIILFLIRKFLKSTKFYMRLRLQRNYSHDFAINQYLLNQMCYREQNQNNQINFVANIDNYEVRYIIESIVRLFIQERRLSLIILESIIRNQEGEYKHIKKSFMNQRIRQKLWENYKSLHDKYKKSVNTIQFKIHEILFKSVMKQENKISRILHISTMQYKFQSMKDLIPDEVITFLDKQKFSGSVRNIQQPYDVSYIMTTQLKLVLNILPLNEVLNRILKKENKSNNFNKKIFSAIKKSESTCLLPFKQILFIINQIYDFQQNRDLIQLKKNDKKMLQRFIEGQEWYEWLEIWIHQKNDKNGDSMIEQQIQFTLNALKKILKHDVNQFWTETEYLGIKRFLSNLFKKQQYTYCFQLFTLIIGNPIDSYVEQTYHNFSNLVSTQKKNIMYQQIYSRMYKQFNIKIKNNKFQGKQHSGFLYKSLKFLCKCVIVSPYQIQLIEYHLINKSTFRSKQGNGFYLILFLLDCIYYFKSNSNFKILKHLIKSITALVQCQYTSKKLAVCLSIYYFEYGQDGSLIDIIQKLKYNSHNNSTSLYGEHKLKKALLKNLLEVLQLNNFEKYFIIPQYNNNNRIDNYYLEITRSNKIKERFKEEPRFYDDTLLSLLNEDCVGTSSWLSDMLRLLQLQPVSESLQIIDILLKRFQCRSNFFTQFEDILLKVFIEILNKARIDKIIIENLSVIQNKSIQNQKLLTIENKRWLNRIFNKDNQKALIQEQICTEIMNTLAVLETIISLANLNLVQSQNKYIKKFLVNLQILQFFQKCIGDKNYILHFQNVYFGTQGQIIDKVNIVLAIASLIDFQSINDISPKINISSNILWSDDAKQSIEYKKFAKYLDLKILKNNRYRCPSKLFEKYMNITVRCIRILTSLVFYWKGLSPRIRPSLNILLNQRNANQQEYIKSVNPVSEDLKIIFKQLLKKLLKENKKQYEVTACAILDFLCVCIKYQPKIIEFVLDSTNTRQPLVVFLQIFIQNISGKQWDRLNINIINKTIMFLRLMIDDKKFQKKLFLLLKLRGFLPAQLLKGINRDRIEDLKRMTIMQSYSLNNIMKQREIYQWILQYSSIEMLIQIIIYCIFKDQFSYNIDQIKILYSGRLVDKFIQVFTFCDLVYDDLRQLSFRFHHSIIRQLDFYGQIPLFQNDIIENFCEISLYGYGKQFQLDSVEYYESIKLNQNNQVEINMCVSLVHRYNLLKSLKCIKQICLKKWGNLFIMLASCGTQGYSLSCEYRNQLKQFKLKQLERDWDKNFLMLNSRNFKLNSGFLMSEISKNESDQFMIQNMIKSILRQFFSTEKSIYEQQFVIILKIKAGLLEVCLKTLLINTDNHSFFTQIQQRLFDIIITAFRSHQQIYNEIQFVSLYSTVIAAMIGQQITTNYNIIQFSINCYIRQEWCITSNLMIGSVIYFLQSYKFEERQKKLLVDKIFAKTFKDKFESFDFIIGIRILVEIIKEDPNILIDERFIEKLQENPIFNSGNISYIQLNKDFYRWILYLLQTLLIYQDQYIISIKVIEFCKNINKIIKSCICNSNLTEIKVQGKQIIQYRLTFQYLEQLDLTMSILCLIMNDPSNWNAKDAAPLFEEFFECLTKNSMFVNLNSIIGYFPNMFEKKLVSIKNRAKKFQTNLFENSNPINKKQIILINQNYYNYFDLEANFYTFLCSISFLSSFQWFFQIMEYGFKYSRIFSQRNKIGQQYWINLQISLANIQKYLLSQFAKVINHQGEIINMLKWYNSYNASVQHSIQTNYTNIFKIEYTYQEFIQLILEKLQGLYKFSIKFIDRWQNSNEEQTNENLIYNFKKRSLTNLIKLRDNIKCNGDLLNISSANMIIWTDLKKIFESKL